MKTYSRSVVGEGIIFSVFLLFFCCTKENERKLIEISSEQYTYSGKQIWAEDHSEWTGGEEICVNGNTYSVIIQDGHAYIDETYATENRAVFPAEVAVDRATEDSIGIILPQNYKYEQFNGRQVLKNPLAAKSAAGRPLQFRHLTGAIYLQLRNDSEKPLQLRKVEISSNKYRLSGETSLLFNNIEGRGTETCEDADGRSVAMLFEDMVIPPSGQMDFMLPILPVGADNRFDIRIESIQDGYRYIYHREQESGGELRRNEIGFSTADITHAEYTTTKAIVEGNGTEEEPYIIQSKDDFDMLMEAIREEYPSPTQSYMNACIRIETDIDLGGEGWKPIQNFRGTLDGQGHHIQGLNIISTEDTAGLFSSLKDATIRDINIDGASMRCSGGDGTKFAGAICGYAEGTRIEGCHITNLTIENSTPTNNYVGGLVGYVKADNDSSVFTDCSFFTNGANLAASGSGNRFGGLVGYIYKGKVRFSDIHISMPETTIGYYANIGGIIGFIRAGGATIRMENCSWVGDFKITRNTSSYPVTIGGLIGSTSASIVFSHCSAVGTINRNGYNRVTVDTLVGSSNSGVVNQFIDCHDDIQIL